MHPTVKSIIFPLRPKDRYRCKQGDLPPYLYRVQYNGTQTERTNEGLLAADTTLDLKDMTDFEFAETIVDQFTWSNCRPTPYISLFSDQAHARNWARRMAFRKGGDVRIFRIKTALLGDTIVFKLSTLVEKLFLDIPDGAAQHIGGAYLCLHKIPAIAIDNETKECGFEINTERRGRHVIHQSNFLTFHSNDSKDGAIQNVLDDSLMTLMKRLRLG